MNLFGSKAPSKPSILDTPPQYTEEYNQMQPPQPPQNMRQQPQPVQQRQPVQHQQYQEPKEEEHKQNEVDYILQNIAEITRQQHVALYVNLMELDKKISDIKTMLLEMKVAKK